MIDRAYLQRRGGAEKVSKLIIIKEGAPEETQIEAFECPFTLRGNPELMRVAWESGVGDHNSMGLGMVEVVGKKIEADLLENGAARSRPFFKKVGF